MPRRNPSGPARLPAGRNALLVALSAAFMMAAAPAHAAGDSAESAVRGYSIPPGPLGRTLSSFAAQSGIALSFDHRLTEGLNSAGLSGNHTTRQGFARLLDGSGLELFRQADGSYGLRRMPVPQGGATMLPEVRVMADGERSATTEGTGTYAAQAATLFKGSRSLREIPQSVSVLTREQMDDQGITRLDDAYTQMTGVRLDGYAYEGRIMSRGFEVGTQLDGIPTAGSGIYRLDAAIYDRVEMLRGPSGLLAGSGEPGGTINLVRKRPRDGFAFSGKLSYGTWNDIRTELDVTGPLNKEASLRGRAVAVWQDKDRFYEKAHEKRGLLYGALEYDLTPNDTLGLSVMRMEDTGNAFWGLPRYSDGSLPGRKTFVGATDMDTTAKITSVIADYQHRFANDWLAKATYSNRDEKHVTAGFYAYDFIDLATGLTSGGGDYGRSKTGYESFDLNFSGPFSLLGRTHQANFGYNRSITETEGRRGYSPYFAAVDVLNRHDWGGSSNAWTPSGHATHTEQSGLYGSVSLRVLEPLSLVLGGRFTDFAYRSRRNHSSAWVDGQKADQEFTPYAGLIWDLNTQVSFYGSYAEIFVPQSERDYTDSMLKPRTGEQFELGVKGAFLNDRLNASLAIYQLRDENRAMDDLDPTHICPGTWSGRCSTAAGKIQSRGLEAEVSGTPVPGLNLSASYAFNRSQYLSDANPANVGKTPQPHRSPKHLAKLWAQYRFADGAQPGALANWTIGGGVIAQSRVHWNDRVQQGSYAIVSARLGYRIDKRASVSLDIDNLFDRVYLTELYDGSYYNIYGRPRSARLTFSYKL